MLERFLSYIQHKNLINNTEKVLLAVSGGQDSMVMVHLFRMAGYHIALAHINHHLRGEESDSEAALVKSYAEEYGLPFFQLDIDPKEFTGHNMQEKARNLRYTWLHELAEKYRFDKIATAHHTDDVVETFFINLMRGSGIMGLDGIKEKNEKIIRPLLFASKNEIAEYCKENFIDYREDSSNKSDKYLRNRLRNKVLPEIYDADKRAKKGIISSIENLRDTSLLLEFLIKKSAENIFVTNSENTTIHLHKFSSDQISSQWLFYLIKDFGFNIEQVSDILNSKSTTGCRFISSSHEAIIDRGKLIIRQNNMAFKFDKEITINSLPFRYQWTDREINITEEIMEGSVPKDHNQVVYINADQLDDEVILRSVRQGDKFQPSGMNGKSQKLKDFFIHHKVNLFDKEKLTVLTHKNEIIAIPGYRKSEKVAITQDTGKIWKIELKNLSNIDSIPG